MGQTCLYDFLDKQTDPLYISVSKLNKGEKLTIDRFDIYFSVFGYYEIACTNTHTLYKTIDDCYDALKKLINEIVIQDSMQNCIQFG